MAAPPALAWVSHPRHLPAAPAGRVVVIDVAFAAGAQWKSKTKKLIDALGERLAAWIDHHEHKEGWAAYGDDPRFILVPNKIAHGSPELVTPERVAAAGAVDVILAHADFDGVVAAAKWLHGGREPWPSADEDARAIDSPGRGHAVSERGAHLAYALEEASVAYKQQREHALLTRVTRALAARESDLALDEELEGLAAAGRAAERAARVRAERAGASIAPGVFLVRLDERPDNRTRRNLLVYAEERARIGALLEPDPQGGSWLIAATFDERLDLSEVEDFEGGRSDYRFARAHGDGAEQIAALVRYAARFA